MTISRTPSICIGKTSNKRKPPTQVNDSDIIFFTSLTFVPRENKTFNVFTAVSAHLYTCDDTHQKYPDSAKVLLSAAVPVQLLTGTRPRKGQASQSQEAPSTPGRRQHRQRTAVEASWQPTHCPSWHRGHEGDVVSEPR